jgi:hypothetical protein
VDYNAWFFPAEETVFAKDGKKIFKTFEEYKQAQQHFCQNGVLIKSLTNFEHVPDNWAEYGGEIDPVLLDLRPTADSPAVDAAKLMPNINDDYTGDGPDIGALEAGKPLPHYGPRTKE